MKLPQVKNYIIAVFAVFLVVLAVQNGCQRVKIETQKAEIKRVKHNYKVARDSVKLIEGENHLLASRIQAQALTVKELKDYYQNIMADVSDMKIQLRRVAGITAFNTETTNHINTFFKDSTITKEKPLEILDYTDQWFDIKVRKEGLKASVSAVSRDSLIQVVHWQRIGKFWPTRFLTAKEYFQDIKSMNPNSKITYSKWITPIKK